MNIRFLFATALLFFHCGGSPKQLTQYVNPFIGTGGHGHTYPGATLPFGMVQLSPDTRLTGWDGCSGYHFTDSIIYGFSHTHLSGTGVSDYGDILLMPVSGVVSFENGAESAEKKGYKSRFSHLKEKASPGYYSVFLEDHEVGVELTATERTGFHKYTFQNDLPASVIIDLFHRDKVLQSSLTIVNDQEIEGMRRSSQWARDQHVYFVARFSRKFKGYELQKKGIKIEGKELSGLDVKGAVHFGSIPGESLLIKVGISAVSMEGARKNLDAEIPDWDFDQMRSEAERAWEEELSKIRITGGTDDQKSVFYSALYHSFLNPNLFSDVEGQYRGMDLQIHHADNTKIYTVFSLWDTFRATHPLFTLTQQKRTRDFIHTFQHQFQDGGILPIWELAGNYTGCMIGYHSVPVIADAYIKGIDDFDAEKMLEAMVHSAEQTQLGLDSYQNKGFISAEDEAESVSKTLEYAYDDATIAMMAKKMGNEKVYQTYQKRAQNYKNLFDPQTHFFRAKQNGNWFGPFDPAEVNFNYTEANAWQYATFVPHDITTLIQLHGGDEAFSSFLDSLFTTSSITSGRDQPDITGLMGQYAHGNEPSHHVAYLYNYAGEPWKCQYYVRKIMNELYTNQPDGLSGNEDCGQMSAWFVMSALGFYPVTPGTEYYTIGSPLFGTARLKLENGKYFEIEARNQSLENVYIQSITLNGQPYPFSYISHTDILKGGKMVVQMGNSPQKNWAVEPNHRPQTVIRDHLITPVPYFVSASRTFTDSLTVSLGTIDSTSAIYFTQDDSTPDTTSTKYSGPFTLDKTTQIQAITYSYQTGLSLPVRSEFFKVKSGRTIKLSTQYANQYAAAGNSALIDYQRGSKDFRTGNWQGYEYVDLDAIVDLGKVTSIKKVSAGFLQDIRSWIWMPKEVEFAVSMDGVEYQSLGRFPSPIPENEYGSIIHEFEVSLKGIKGRFISVKAKNYQKCPDWHLGAGGKTWIFADEIQIE